jgi:hypothetical protein
MEQIAGCKRLDREQHDGHVAPAKRRILMLRRFSTVMASVSVLVCLANAGEESAAGDAQQRELPPGIRLTLRLGRDEHSKQVVELVAHNITQKDISIPGCWTCQGGYGTLSVRAPEGKWKGIGRGGCKVGHGKPKPVVVPAQATLRIDTPATIDRLLQDSSAEPPTGIQIRWDGRWGDEVPVYHLTKSTAETWSLATAPNRPDSGDGK